MNTSYLSSVIKQFEYYKSLGDKTISQLTFEELKKEFEELKSNLEASGILKNHIN